MKSILVVRLSAIGDIVFSSPLIAALRRRWPQARICWLVQPECAALLDRHPDLDEVIVCPLRRWQQLLRERRFGELRNCVLTLRENLIARDFDLAIDLQGLLKSGLLTWLSGARERVGLGSREGSQWLMTRRLDRGGDPDRIGSEYLYLAEQLGLPVDDFRMAVHYGPAESAFAEALIAREELGGGYAVFCPFTTRPQKHWFEGHWARLAPRIRDAFGLVPVLLGGPADRAAGQRIADEAEEHLVDLTGQTSLTEAAAVIDRADLLVAVDTGLGHMGIAFGTPSLLLFGSTCPYLDTTREDARVLYHPLPCSPCKRRPTCEGRFDCMRAITTDEVVETARQVLGVTA
ncbi:glycosyltransferase family 9 protein [Imhoffiella purpurea]|uniref:ADP-heptose--lipooligosaccharide heptosyltransferase II n=1 Tax=Imhoffiella purpurea TaxID=1249627 RepID=W9VLS7_9GAMM|nr:glycosyltransferase family 9 protein [Imhoffiella purpurea]EXJ17057.1 ADP-heptose--lipooligosaccharide heptosyltransferase II [Imhoffiella purpurea]